MSSSTGAPALGQGVFQQVPARRVISAALTVGMGHVENRLDICPDQLRDPRLGVPDRFKHTSNGSQVHRAYSQRPDLGEGVDLKRAHPLEAVLLAVPLRLVAFVVPARRGLERDGPGIFESLCLSTTLPVSPWVAVLAQDQPQLSGCIAGSHDRNVSNTAQTQFGHLRASAIDESPGFSGARF